MEITRGVIIKTIKNELITFSTITVTIATFLGLLTLTIHFIVWNFSFVDLRILITLIILNISLLIFIRKDNAKIK